MVEQTDIRECQNLISRILMLKYKQIGICGAKSLRCCLRTYLQFLGLDFRGALLLTLYLIVQESLFENDIYDHSQRVAMCFLTI